MFLVLIDLYCVEKLTVVLDFYEALKTYSRIEVAKQKLRKWAIGSICFYGSAFTIPAESANVGATTTVKI